MTSPRILAPAGGPEQLLAAVRCGAEGVYLGTGAFQARRNATNFTPEQLAGAVRMCHIRGVKVYVTVNTLVMDREMPALEETAETIACAGADGVILQDPGILPLFVHRYPGLHRVASTQTAVHNVDGALFLQEAGFDSFVLARELTLEEMARICGAVSIPAEAFVHGAHCMSLSGACTLSAMLGGRSGNRGLCAQPCRLAWHCGRCDHALSLKDMSLLDHIPALASAGVAELKIEGRMKRPEYVAAAVTACRLAREGKPYDQENLAAVFSRSGFTVGYLLGKRDRSMFGFRTREDVAAQEAVLPALAELYRKETPRVPVEMDFVLSVTESRLTVRDGTHTVTETGPGPEKALHRPLDGDLARQYLCRTGGTAYFVSSFQAALAPGLTLSAARLSALRRQALARLDGLRGAVQEPERKPWQRPPVCRRSHPGSSPLWARFARREQIAGEEDLQRILLPAGEITLELLAHLGNKLTAQLPAVLFPDEEPDWEPLLRSLQQAGLREVWADNMYAVRLAMRLGLTVRGGFGLNVANSQALTFWQEQGLASATVSFELPMGQIREMDSSLPWGLAVYGHLPLMQWRACPVRAHLGCRACGGQGFLTDRRGIRFPVECDRQHSACLLNSVPLAIGDRDDPGDFRLAWFTRETPVQGREIIARLLARQPCPGPHTGGLYYRKLL